MTAPLLKGKPGTFWRGSDAVGRWSGLGWVMLAFGGLGPGMASGDEAAVACHAFTPDAEYVETTVIRQLEGGEVTLRVPEQYFEDTWDRAGGFTDTAQLFRVEIGTFEPVSRRETGKRNRQGIWNWMTFVVADLVPLPEIAAIAAMASGWPKPPITSYALRPGEHGLTWLGTPQASDKPDARDDVFIAPPDYAAMTTVIDRTELPRWREFQAQVTAFLTCAAAPGEPA